MNRTQTESYIDALNPRVFTYIQYADYADRYPTHTVHEFPQAFYDEMRTASAGLFHIFCKAAQVLQNAPDDFARAMDLPRELLPYLRIPNAFGLPTWLSRFDFVLDEKGHIRMVEINADTPCFIVESFYANGVAAAYHGRRDPNAGARAQLRDFLTRIHNQLAAPIADLKRQMLTHRPFVFSCFDDYPEDLATTRFLMEQMQEGVPHGDIRFRSFYEMEIDARGIPLTDNSYASALYRLHPMEILIDERTADGEPLGAMFLDLYQEGCFALMNPPEAILLQNKSFMALVHALAASEQFFTPDECALVRRYLVPSYFEDDFDALGDGRYIRKEIWGREGRNVRVVQKHFNEHTTAFEKKIDYADEVICRESRAAMYQDFVRQPRFVHTVDSGTTDGCLTLSCFMLFDTPSAVGARFSPAEIAGTEAYFVPLVITE
ncbi:glutathionylspermidine synthase preATP-grasp domain protein [Selenomonas sp. FOBRC6]|uniref:glutathionylspermidine synthase family protein n=1 Tax=Selenomonas sp. FOBRC6 TaxID=936572 RepID=UPI000277EAF0|nr:glutathionylspermidine synthase family protein [Selenomonas sp. FOBRC6]EJO23589.1 glutathionylspermidine synthase preATP-grasp domain protein [Selenomonas sp. FOBRC6]